jgi:pimeloyl-ACP methyl ester carboxylesterase
MTDTIVLLHGGATGPSWNPVARTLVSSGASVFAPDMLGYGRSPAPSSSYGIAERSNANG